MSEKPHPAAIDVNGAWYLRNAKNSLVPIALVKPVDLLIDELVRDVHDTARKLSAELKAFKLGAFERIGGLQALLEQDYDAPIGGKKGNITLSTYNGCGKIQIAAADRFEFGPELQVAKTLIDDCLREWAVDSRVEIRALVDHVFAVDKEGQISHAGLFMLLRVDIQDAQWKRAMDAVRDSIRIIGSRTYIRMYDRETADVAWSGISLDIASA